MALSHNTASTAFICMVLSAPVARVHMIFASWVVRRVQYLICNVRGSFNSHEMTFELDVQIPWFFQLPGHESRI